MSKRLLVVDDDIMIQKLFRLECEQRDLDWDVVTADGGSEAIAAMESAKPSLLVLDLRMTKGDGFAVLEHMQQQQYDFPVVILTNYNKPEYRERCSGFSMVHEYIVKSDMRFGQIMEKLCGYVAA